MLGTAPLSSAEACAGARSCLEEGEIHTAGWVTMAMKVVACLTTLEASAQHLCFNLSTMARVIC